MGACSVSEILLLIKDNTSYVLKFCLYNIMIWKMVTFTRKGRTIWSLWFAVFGGYWNRLLQNSIISSWIAHFLLFYFRKQSLWFFIFTLKDLFFACFRLTQFANHWACFWFKTFFFQSQILREQGYIKILCIFTCNENYYYKLFLLKYNYCSLLKWFLVYSQVMPPSGPISEYFYHPTKNPIPVSSHSARPSPPSSWPPLVNFCLYVFAVSGYFLQVKLYTKWSSVWLLHLA